MKRSLEIKIYIGVPRVRNAMPPPPYPRQHPRGGSSMPTCVFARRQGHIASSSTGRAHRHRSTGCMQRGGGGGSAGGRLMPASFTMHTYAIIMQLFWRFSMQSRCVSNKRFFLFIILIFYRRSVFNAFRPVCCEMNVVLLK